MVRKKEESYVQFRDLVLSFVPQQGHHAPCHSRNIWQLWHRFWPLRYLPKLAGPCALWRTQIPLQILANS